MEIALAAARYYVFVDAMYDIAKYSLDTHATGSQLSTNCKIQLWKKC